MNRAAETFFGYAHSYLTKLKSGLLELVVFPDDLGMAYDHLEIARKLADGETHCCALRVIPGNSISSLTAKFCYICVEHDGEQAVEIEVYVYKMPTYEYDMRNLLKMAVPRGELVLYYQPICDLATGELCGYEALARLKRGTEIFAPNFFLPHLDGQLEKDWVAQQIDQIGVTLDKLPPPLWVSLNASEQVLATGLLITLLEGHRHIGRIGIEVLESTSLSCPDAVKNLHLLNTMGIILKADDIGNKETGGGLDRLLEEDLFSVIKLDGELTRHLNEPKKASITKHLLGIASEARLKTIAEWVTSAPQAEWLGQHGCLMGQGELYGMPGPLVFDDDSDR
jgi:EAL domain-containing protein (putative c-di-GMP-specific phosphodiesterase class I)